MAQSGANATCPWREGAAYLSATELTENLASGDARYDAQSPMEISISFRPIQCLACFGPSYLVGRSSGYWGLE